MADVLTRRQLEIGRLAAKGHTAAQIAELIGITRRTVEQHVWDAGHGLPGMGMPRQKLVLYVALNDEGEPALGHHNKPPRSAHLTNSSSPERGDSP